MADQKISAMPAMTALAGTEKFAGVQSSINSVGTPAQIKTYTQIGTTTNDDAGAGVIGQIIESEVLVGSAVSMTTGNVFDITTLSLTAGDWNVWANFWISPAVGTYITDLRCAISTVSATLPTIPNKGGYVRNSHAATVGQEEGIFCMRRISIASTTTIYLVARAGFTIDTLSGYGAMIARRMR